MMQGFVIVSVKEDQIAPFEHRVCDNLVGSARTVQDEVGFIGAEYLGSVALGLSGGPFVNEQVPEPHVGITEVISKNALAEVFEEELTRGRLPIELTTLMARTVEGDIGLGIVGHQPAKEWGQQPHSIVDQTGDHLLGVEGGCLLSQIDVARDLAEKIEAADVGDAVRVRQTPQRRLEPGSADGAYQGTSAIETVAVDHCDVCTDSGVLGDISVEGGARFDLEVLCTDPIEELPDLGTLDVDDHDDLKQLVERNGNRGCFDPGSRCARSATCGVFSRSDSVGRDLCGGTGDLFRKSRQCTPSRKKKCSSGCKPVARPCGDSRMLRRAAG